MLVYNITTEEIVNSKVEQLKTIGLTTTELENISQILYSSYSSASKRDSEENSDLRKLMKFSNFEDLYKSHQLVPCAITYNISAGDVHQYNMVSLNSKADPMLGYVPVNSLYVMNNSSEFGPVKTNSDSDIPDSTKSSRKYTYSGSLEELKTTAKGQKTLPLCNKISLLKKVLEGIRDESQVLISSKPKNKSTKIRKSNRHSKFRGVSLNGKKWQVMIMGPIKKKYFGGIATEREAAIFYDKLSILTNGLAAKTNFNYRKSDLMKIMAELEYMEPIVSN